MECDAFMLKKSIGIVTLQDSPNCGARLQALAMFLTLKMFTFDVHFLKTNARSVVKRNLKNIVKKIIKCRFKHAFFLIRQIYSYSSSKIRFQSQNFTEFKRKDIVVFGSDEIWNVSRKSISQYPFFWGAELSAHKISFAPSINSATITDFEKMKLQDDFSEFKAISVRDFHSQNVLETFLNKKIDVVCDPTMLLSAKQWYGYEKECSRKSDFILLYAYGRQFNQDDIKKILAFAREENLAIVSALVYYEFADENLPCNPEQFLGYIHKAKYVITSTFHGTCFSLIYGKKFVTISRNNPKVVELLKKFEIEEMNAIDDRPLSKVFDLNTEEQMAQRQRILDAFRNNSFNWLNEQLTSI